ncbi:hypothetical protein ACM0P6_00930 [Komagataeibacter sucrofermentans]|uniref:DUF3325 domain-containing protein n=1 Tax=Komagataeibacter sucrofermentans TaxID=1053551 RepID=A0A318QSY3_9PROT|nr:hypothetical protein [Komagataeibacter sucrofermentans]PYD80442.1 hypothetical protein CFR77_03340 [Komagataeibacter sucrofermentans]GBQ46997.1 hypothetical protein AA15973_1067 [Komagataeibacter sucrofermentans DSM 15973]
MTCLFLLALWVAAFMCHAALWPTRYGLPAFHPTGQRRARMMRLLLPLLALGLAVGVQGFVVGLLSWCAALSLGGLLAASLLALKGRQADRL